MHKEQTSVCWVIKGWVIKGLPEKLTFKQDFKGSIRESSTRRKRIAVKTKRTKYISSCRHERAWWNLEWATSLVPVLDVKVCVPQWGEESRSARAIPHKSIMWVRIGYRWSTETNNTKSSVVLYHSFFTHSCKVCRGSICCSNAAALHMLAQHCRRLQYHGTSCQHEASWFKCYFKTFLLDSLSKGGPLRKGLTKEIINESCIFFF